MKTKEIEQPPDTDDKQEWRQEDCSVWEGVITDDARTDRASDETVRQGM